MCLRTYMYNIMYPEKENDYVCIFVSNQTDEEETIHYYLRFKIFFLHTYMNLYLLHTSEYRYSAPYHDNTEKYI